MLSSIVPVHNFSDHWDIVMAAADCDCYENQLTGAFLQLAPERFLRELEQCDTSKYHKLAGARLWTIQRAVLLSNVYHLKFQNHVRQTIPVA